MTKTGIIIISHVYEIAKGINRLIQEVAGDVDIEVIGGLSETEIGTSFDSILEAINKHPSDNLLAFYDLGSAKMNLDMAKELSDKSITIYDVPIVEGAYTAAALLQAGVTQEAIEEQLKEIQIDK
ncbi:PTS-dependent dihydroxyacetone kinase phosphotransferase subunit DhaM [Listeria monocytogenes]|uniref:dihydroxyacetone kinase phosphoryl donor subunit DhaM n=1 Tax=Marinilactibacillus sp. 15R TaxID=1911586 RepID=UPI00090A03CF|nr:dihydroxyacetone kinase phosphoryl donor subunit DhaM [Marinilactibacillus sp. 15R]API88358.1 PTS-dependent dihydroxyacetone kinase phosphotransferase subunit DhaM [Marinilactibacillus sp. 15R]EAH2637963.1 PTS-dependent dihydroxyacetone kinase phosphotransferase subunit DhaM [Listeria monocytogenes]EHD0417793.1 PTS-dependent dihydroxyacetone kinase phosphotransferase subunit DhaM [Listeria monocytogenes]EIC1657340.1 PTS-dependent dihydroxyacetone kinase phosphotransferase subunit DhaM [Liste